MKKLERLTGEEKTTLVTLLRRTLLLELINLLEDKVWNRTMERYLKSELMGFKDVHERRIRK